MDYIDTIPFNDLMKLKTMKYRQFLRTKYWSIIKLWKKALAKHKCERCGMPEDWAKMKLHIHHKTYLHRGMEYLYPDDIECICENCHSLKHDLISNEVAKKNIKQWSKHWSKK